MKIPASPRMGRNRIPGDTIDGKEAT